MIQGHQSQRFYAIGSVSYLQGRKDIADLFMKQAGKLSKKEKYDLRKKILGMRFFDNIQSLAGDIQVTINHTIYKYHKAEQAVILENCQDYHPYHIDYIAQKIRQRGTFSCINENCQAICCSTLDIKLNAFTASYFDNVKHFQNVTLIFKRESIGSIEIEAKEKQLINSKDNSNQTIVDLVDKPGYYHIIRIEVLQLDNFDERVKQLNTHQLIQKIKVLEEKGQTFYESELSSSNGQILMNLICFKTHVRIRNPLLHKDCRPSDHNNRLIAFSFQQVYSELLHKNFDSKKKKSKSQQKRINCIFPGCNNYFSASNFDEVAIIIRRVRQQVYREDKQCIFGQFCGGIYNKNWYSNLQITSLTEFERNSIDIAKRYKIIKENVQTLLSTANLQKKKRRKIYKELKKDISSFKKLQFVEGFEGRVIKVNIGQRNLCPIRCFQCQTLNSIDAFTLPFHIYFSNQICCPLCNPHLEKTASKYSTKFFYQRFKLDLDLLEFIFISGYSKDVYYDIEEQKYFHKMNFFTGKTLRVNLLLENRILNKNIFSCPINIKLDKKKRYIPFISSQCSSKSQKQVNYHIFLIDQKERFKNSLQYGVGIQKILDSNLKCGYCKTQLRSDRIWYCEDLQKQLIKANNQLKWDGNGQNNVANRRLTIQTLNYYSDIRNQCKLPSNSSIQVYWRNQMGFLIKFPFKFKGCIHPFSTTICDFTDLIYQKKLKNQTKFKCRYKPCQKEYSQIDDLERVPLQIYKCLQENQLIAKVINECRYWLQYDIQNRKIIKARSIFQDQISEGSEQQMNINSYRDIYDNLVLNKKEMKDASAQIVSGIKNLKQRFQQDKFHHQKKGDYRYSNSKEEFDSSKLKLENLKKQGQRVEWSLSKLEQQQKKQNRQQNRTSNLNFRKLIQIYPNQAAKLSNSNKEQFSQKGLSRIQNDNYQTMGNLGIFKYKVPHQKQRLSTKQLKQLEQIL